MKRLFALLLCLCGLLAGCGQSAPETQADPIPDEPPMPVAEYQRGDYVNISMPLPDGWEWESDQDTKDGVPITQYPERQGFWFWKTDEPEFRFSFTCWPNGFGMCGTGVDFSQVGDKHDLTLAEEKYEDGVYVTIIFNDVPGSYIVEGSVSTALWEEYREAVIKLVDDSTVADGCMTQQEAVDIIRAQYNWPGETCEIYGNYNAAEGVWQLRLLDTLPGGEEFTACARVSNSGEILELARDDGSDLPLVWNEENLSSTPRVDENT